MSRLGDASFKDGLRRRIRGCPGPEFKLDRFRLRFRRGRWQVPDDVDRVTRGGGIGNAPLPKAVDHGLTIRNACRLHEQNAASRETAVDRKTSRKRAGPGERSTTKWILGIGASVAVTTKDLRCGEVVSQPCVEAGQHPNT